MTQQHAKSGFAATFFGLIAVVALVVVHYLWTGRWDAQVRAHLEQRIASYWPHLNVTIQSARYVTGKGFEIRGLRLAQRSDPSDPASATALPGCQVACEELLIYCTSSLSELLSNCVEIRGVLCKRPAIRIVYDEQGIASPNDWRPVLDPMRSPFPIHVQQGTVDLVDRRTSPARTVSLRDLQGLLRPIDATATTPVAWQLEASTAGDLIRRGVASGRIWTARHWDLQMSLTDVLVSSELTAALPSFLASQFRPLETLEGACGLTIRASHQPDAESVDYAVNGQFRNGRLIDTRWIHPLTEVHGAFEMDRGRTIIRDLSARYGSAMIAANAEILGGSSPSGSRITGSICGLTLSDTIRRILPPTLSDAYQLLQPGGDVDVTWALVHDGTRWIPKGEVQCRNVSFAWRKFPLPVEEIVGSLNYESDRLKIDVSGRCANRPVEIRGEVVQPGTHWTGWCAYKTREPIPLDDRFLTALPDRFQRGLSTLAPRGSFLIDGHASRQRPGDKIEYRSMIEIVEGTVRPALFPYLFQDLRGRIEQQGNRWLFHDVTGRNDSATFRARGDWTVHESAGGALQLQLSASNVAFEEELRAALSPSAQRLWRQFRPQGVIDSADVTYQLDTATRQKQLRITLHSHASPETSIASSISLYPRAFPYRMDDVTGRVDYQDGKIQMHNLRAHHGRTQFTANGEATMHADGRWDLVFRELLADRCRPDRDLLTALPTRLRRVLEQLHATGEVCLRGQLQLLGQVDDPQQSRSSWDLALDIADATATAGVVLKNVSGEARVSGQSDPHSYQCQGRLMLDSLMANRVHCTGIHGPIWIDQDRIYLGDWSKFAQPDVSIDAATLSPVYANVFGGQTLVHAEFIPARNGVFRVQARIDDMKLDQLARDLALSQGPSRGTAAAQFELEGDARGTATWRGNGNLAVRETDLYRLPVTLALLKQFRTGSRDRIAFDAADLAVRMQGQHLYFDRIDLHGDAVTLKGVGEMSLRRDLNLNFYTMMGREDSYLPAVRPLLGLASQRFLLVRVEGTLDQPVTSREILPAINETLEQLFPELAPRPPATGSPGVIRTVSGP